MITWFSHLNKVDSMKKKIRTIKDYFHYQTKQTPLKPAALPGAAPSAPRPATGAFPAAASPSRPRPLPFLSGSVSSSFAFLPILPRPFSCVPRLGFYPRSSRSRLPSSENPRRQSSRTCDVGGQKTDAARSVSTKTTLCSSGTPRGKFSENDVL